MSGLSADDRQWLLERAPRVGGVTRAFVYLVRLNILADAILDTSTKLQFLKTELLAEGFHPADALECAATLLDHRLSLSMTRRLVHSANWTRPAPDDRRYLYDDPALSLPHAFTRQLIREGRGVFAAANRRLRARRQCH